MSSASLLLDLSSFFIPLGISGTVLAVVCASVSAVALVYGFAGVGVGALSLWMVGTLLSLATGFAEEWTPPIMAAASLPALVLTVSIVRVST
ncbi:hypothetical protein ACFVWL_08430 [Microbacterium sp. NPDC058269]|uniref:hypothetical protein n=1 Tax=Microbacterium sp. NPDC058269 TaxID=3346414 RepID=UPI0036DCC219